MDTQAPYSGLAQLMEMRGRRGDSMLVHMNPMEVRMLEAMSPDGSLSVNPETGLPEAFKLRDIAALALPIAGSIAMPMLAPGLVGALGATGTAALGTGLGGLGAGLIQGRGIKDSVIQGGLSGLMSYGLGSATGAFAPSGGVTASQPAAADMSAAGPGMMSTAPQTAGQSAAESPGFFGRLGDTLQQTPFSNVPAVGDPTYGSMAAAGGSGLLASGLLAPEEMPYEVEDMRGPGFNADLAGGRTRGRAAARQLQYPPSGLTGAGYQGLATGPSGFGTFLAAEGGRVPQGMTINGQPHQLSYINDREAGLLRRLGGAGREVYGIPAYYDASNDGGDAAGPAGGGVGASNDGGDAAGPAGVSGDVDADTAAAAAAIGEAAAFGDIGSQAVGLGFGGDPGMGSMSEAAQTNAAIGRGIMSLMSPVPAFAVRGAAQALGQAATALGVPGTTESASSAVAGQEAAQSSMGMGDVYGEPYGGDPYNTNRSLASGGIAGLAAGGPAGYANQTFEGMVPGPGTGMSDEVPFTIEGNQPALLSRDEYVLPADVVSQLGDGSSGAGADMLDYFISQVRQTKYGNAEQPDPVGPQLMAGLMRQGGSV